MLLIGIVDINNELDTFLIALVQGLHASKSHDGCGTTLPRTVPSSQNVYEA